MPLRIPGPTTAEIADAVWEQLARTLTDPVAYKADVSDLVLEIQHDSYIFPKDTNLFVTFTAGVGDNEWSDWAEIVDGSANKFSDEITANAHISALMIEDANIKDKAYMIEIAYGDDKTVVTPYRFLSGETKLPAIQQMQIRADHIPAGEDVYYKMKCETGGKTCSLHIRYHHH